MTNIEKKYHKKRAIITEELFALTEDLLSTVILRQFIYWLPRKNDLNIFIKEEQQMKDGEKDINLTGGWIYKSAKELKSEIMASQSEATILRRIEKLTAMGWLQRRRNPKFGYDKTYQYRVMINKIEMDLAELGYSLETVMGHDYKKVSCVFDDDSSKFQGEETNLHDAVSNLQDEAAILEITNKELAIKEYITYDNKASQSLPPHPSLRDGNGMTLFGDKYRRKHPAIQAIKLVSGYYPPKKLYEPIINLLSDQPDIKRMKNIYNLWISKGRNPRNYEGWLFERYPNSAYYTNPAQKEVLKYCE